MHRCSYCQASFETNVELVKHRDRLHWDDYLDRPKLWSWEQLAAEGMIGRNGGEVRYH